MPSPTQGHIQTLSSVPAAFQLAPALLNLPQPRIRTCGCLTSRVSFSSRSAREGGDVEPHHLLGCCPA